MIVSLKADGYKALFADANNFLQLSGKDEISTINEYYTHMTEFLANGGYRFLMLPLNGQGEEDFKIDLNTRQITVPSAFQKIGAV